MARDDSPVIPGLVDVPDEQLPTIAEIEEDEGVESGTIQDMFDDEGLFTG